jgi:hypothetical protein
MVSRLCSVVPRRYLEARSCLALAVGMFDSGQYSAIPLDQPLQRLSRFPHTPETIDDLR